ncbi:MAG: hypothetical protein AB7I13_00040 [Vicinamibacterales bacterium]
MTPLQIDPDVPTCGALKSKGNPRTLESHDFVCALPAGHVRGGQLYHEGVDQFGNRMGWPASDAEVAGTVAA